MADSQMMRVIWILQRAQHALQFDDLNDDESDAEFDDYAYTESQLVAWSRDLSGLSA